MIPPAIIRFIEERANVGFAGTRDRDLVPRGHRVVGWRVGRGGGTFTALLPQASEDAIEALLDNGRVAITLEQVGTHETYQLKGRYVSHRPVEPADIELAGRLRERFVSGLRAVYNDAAALLGASIARPALVIEVQIDEVFLQTPGPGAGTRLAPPPDDGGRAR